MQTTPFLLVLLGGALLAPMTAQAQMGNDPRPPTAPGPTVPGPRPDETLTDQMNRTNGVIPPARNLDPDMTKPAPDGGTTPVLPPPDRAPGIPR